MSIKRREFLKYSAGGLALAAVPVFDQKRLAPFMSAPLGEQMGVLIDTTKCVGCRACQAACKVKNDLPPDPQLVPGAKPVPTGLSATTFTFVDFVGVPGKTDMQPVKKQCMHCVNPACASVCPVQAIYKTPKGPVVYDPEKCMGCRYCLAACPFNVPKFEFTSANPRIRKCTFCADRLAQGLQPACVEACPTKTLTFGKRSELVAEAQNRVQATPDKYVPYIYGLSEVGGTSVLYLANVAFDQLGFRMDLPKEAMPEFTMAVMEKVPAVAVGVGLLMGCVAWFTGRKKNDDLHAGPDE